MIGAVAGNYKIVDKIGEGGMGAVYKGIDMMLEREVAIKVLRPELARQPDIVERFRIEAVTLAKLNHPNIATLFSFFRQGDDYFMVMEFVRGETLENRMRRQGAMAPAVAIPLFCQALEGIDHAHRMGIVHRDIKPANMMLTEGGSIKVMDFGIARVLGSARMTKQGSVIGTIEYMSPEQIQGQETDARSDIYSLGILLYEMLTGRVPFAGDSDYKVMQCQIEMPPVPPRAISPNIPPAIEFEIMRALAKQPSQRPRSAAEFRQVLLSGLSAPVGETRRPAPPQPVPETRIQAPPQPWPGTYGYQPASQGPQAPGGYPNQGGGIPGGPPGGYPNQGAGYPNAGAGGYPPGAHGPRPYGPGPYENAGPGYQTPGVAPAPVPGPGPGFQPGVGQPQPTVDYWQSPWQSPKQQQSARPGLLSKLTWKHYLGVAIAICLLVIAPFLIWLVLQMAGPTTAADYIERGDKLAAQRKWAAAEAEYKHAAALQAPDAATDFKTYVTLVRQNRNVDAQEAYRRIDQNSEWPQIETYYRNALLKQPGTGDYDQYLSVALSAEKKYPEAEETIRRAVGIDPTYAPYHNTLAATLDDQGKTADAESEYNQAIKLDSKFTGPRLGLGSLLFREKQYSAAEVNYRQAVSIDPGYPPAHLGLGASLRAQQKSAEAETEFREAIRLDPKNSTAHTLLGDVLTGQKQYAEAGTEYREAIEIDPKNTDGHAGLGFSLYQLKRYTDAEAQYKEALQLDPRNAELHYALGNCLNDDTKYADAEGELREAIRLEPNYSNAHNNLGVALEREGKLLAAVFSYREAIRLDPNNTAAKSNLDRIASQFQSSYGQ